jgi:hypothetical protein
MGDIEMHTKVLSAVLKERDLGGVYMGGLSSSSPSPSSSLSCGCRVLKDLGRLTPGI